MNEYPSEWECDVVLSDGTTAHVRPIVANDRSQFEALYERSSRRTRYMRFFSAPRHIPDPLLDRFVNVDYADRMALVAERGEMVIAVGSYDRQRDKAVAEVAFMVDDEFQGRGLGTLLLEHLAVIGARHGIERFMALTLPENDEMLGVFQSAGFSVTRVRFGDSKPAVELSFPIAATEASVRAREERDRNAVLRSIDPILRPSSVAVIGASNQLGSIGYRLIDNLHRGGFHGLVYPVNLHAVEIAGVACVPGIASIDGPVDLAIVAVPAASVEAVVEECGHAGVRGLVIISGGFAERGAEGRDRQSGVVEMAHRHGMRIIGPNCMGVLNTDPEISLDATVAMDRPSEETGGRVALMSQSGGVGVAALSEARRRGMGLSSFVSVGNKADISGNDLLQYWESDPRTDVIMLYLESFGNPRNFARIARRVSMTKPILAVKGGRTSAGARASAAHRATHEGPEVAVDELFRQTGVTRADTLDELFDVAQGFAKSPIPGGRSVAIVGNSGGPGTLAADACEDNHLALATLHASTSNALRSFLGETANVNNPVDLVATASAVDYRRAVLALLADDAVDSIVVTHVATTPEPLDAILEGVDEAIAHYGDSGRAKCVTVAALGLAPSADMILRTKLPVYRFPETAVRVVARLADRTEWLAHSLGDTPVEIRIDSGSVRRIVDAALLRCPEERWLDDVGAAELITAAGLGCAPLAAADSVDQAVELANEFGYPVAMKAAGRTVSGEARHDTVHLNLHSDFDVHCAYIDMQRRMGGSFAGVLVQPMAPSGVEMQIRITNDRHFGPLVVVGAGGVGAEQYSDRAARIVPLRVSDASAMVDSLRIARMLGGFRGSKPVDIESLVRAIEQVAALADQVPELAEVDLNPVIVAENGAVVVDAKVLLGPAPDHPEDHMRRLRR